ncbi:5544_t:CDS:10 [Acaulospora morrowiae]|uniref:RNA-directed RNA polymerase n=1 Tax=Acaulospora morrowiae TaxID=94023 RepID=A0A9N8YT54_9GLOM|nr:5544_t:CDS:10 [Acaulospora morrowiae]
MTTSTRKYYFLPSETDKIKHSIAGAVAGCVSSIVTCPLDVVKTRLQNQGRYSNDCRVPLYNGTGGTLKRIWTEEGIRGLYRGLGPTLYGYLPTWAIYFSAYDYFKSTLAERAGQTSGQQWIVHIIAAMGAGASSTVVTNPLWVIKTRFMTQNETTAYKYRNTLDAFATIYRSEGMRGFYKGLGPSLMGVSHVAVQFPLYEKMKTWLKPPDKDHLSNVSILLASSVSKMAASIATYPHEVVRTRLQNQTRKPFKYQGVFHAVKVIEKEEGWTAFYKGMSTNLLRTVPASALTILTYEILVRRLNANISKGDNRRDSDFLNHPKGWNLPKNHLNTVVTPPPPHYQLYADHFRVKLWNYVLNACNMYRNSPNNNYYNSNGNNRYHNGNGNNRRSSGNGNSRHYNNNGNNRNYNGNGNYKQNGHDRLLPPINYRNFSELTLRVSNISLRTPVLELRQFFDMYGDVFKIQIDTVEGERGEKPTGQAVVTFRPPPQEPFWLQTVRHHGRILYLYHAKPSPAFSYSDGKSRLKPSSFSARSLELGMFLKKDTFVSEFKYTEDVKFMIDYNRRDIKVTFSISSYTFKLEIQFKDIVENFIEWDESNRSHVCLTIANKYPARYWMLDTKMKPRSEFVWRLNDSWKRKTELSIRAPSDEDKALPLQLNMPNFSDQLGKMIVFRLTFNLGTNAEIREFKNMIKEAGEYNLVPMSGEIDTNLRLRVISGNTLRKHVDRSMLDFDVLYMTESNLSHNYLHDYNLGDEFYKILFSQPKSVALDIMEKISVTKQRVYDPLTYLKLEIRNFTAQQSRKVPPYCVMMRKVVVTPTTMYILPPTMETSNRVIRHFKSYKDNFLRVQFVDEAAGTVGASNNNKALYNRIFNILVNGIKIGDRNYEFLAFSSSQLREHSCWFFAPIPDLTADDIRAWMGDFSSNKNIAKYAARMGQCFSSTRAILTLPVNDIKEIPDIIRNGYNFSDGTGKISHALAQKIAITLELKTTPCAFQFRLAGYKGVLCQSRYLRGMGIQVRPSQHKFDSTHNVLEIIRGSCMITAYLNRQAITILSALGVPNEVFVEMKDAQVQELDKMLKSESTAVKVLQQNIDEYGMTKIMAELVKAGFLYYKDPYLVNLISLFRITVLRDLKKKAKIRVSDGAFLLGVLDETETLEEDQIYCCKSDPNNPNARQVIKGPCIVFRNPCFHPGDVRVVTAVDCKKLDHLIDVLVFPAKGYRDIPSQLSGGDLDGDDFTIIYDPKLIPKIKNVEPMNYEAPKADTVDDVAIHDVKKFFVNYILSDQLGQIANAHLANADIEESGAFHGKCIRLAQLHSAAVDFPKTGIPAEFPLDLKVEKFPDFMEKPDKPSYESKKVLGILYRSILVDEFNPYVDISFDERLYVEGFERYLEKARTLKRAYDTELRGLMNQFGVSSEYEVSSGFIVKPTVKIEKKKPRDVQKSVADNITVIKRNYKKTFELEFYGEGNFISPEDEKNMEAKAFAWYYVTYHQSEISADPSERMISFPWINWDILAKVAIRNSGRSRNTPESYRPKAPTVTISPHLQERTHILNHISDFSEEDDGMNRLRESLKMVNYRK